MPNVTSDGITLINFGMDSPKPRRYGSVERHFAGKPYCFSKMWRFETQEPDWRLILPNCGPSGERYLERLPAAGGPALPAFQLQRARRHDPDLGYDYWTGTVYTTNRRVWEHDDRFRDLCVGASMAIDMETATMLCCGICQPHSDRRTASWSRSANDPRGREDRGIRS